MNAWLWLSLVCLVVALLLLVIERRRKSVELTRRFVRDMLENYGLLREIER